MCIYTKKLGVLYLKFISSYIVLKEKFGVTNFYIYKSIGHVVLNVYIFTYSFEDARIIEQVSLLELTLHLVTTLELS